MGMFSYYFKTKSNFIRKVLESFREDILKSAGSENLEGKTSLERLRNYLIILGSGFCSQRKLILSLYRDILNQDPDVSELVLAKTDKQGKALQEMIKQCQKDGYINPDISVTQIELFLISIIKAPIIMAAAFERLKKGNRKSSLKIDKELTTEKGIAQRVDMALQGITAVLSKTTKE